MDIAATDLTIRIFDSPEQAPNYELPKTTSLGIKEACIVKKGVVEGRPTVDLVLVDENGKHFVTMITGRLVQGLASAVAGCDDD